MPRVCSAAISMLGPAMAVAFCVISLMALCGWTYIFVTEQPQQLTKEGARLAIFVGFQLIHVWWLTLVGLLVATLVQRWRPHVAWIVPCLVIGAAGGIACCAGWIVFLGPAV